VSQTRVMGPSQPGSVRELWTHRELVLNLTRRDLKAKYKRSLLGWLWSLINPAASLLIYWVVFGVIFGAEAPIAGNGELQNFALYLYAGLVTWNAFAASFTGSLGAWADSGPLLTKVYFPPAAPAIASVTGVLTQHAIEMGILVVIMIVLGNAGWTMLLLPVYSLLVIAFGMGLGMVAGLAQTRFRDVGYIVGIGLQFLFYATPIVYPPTIDATFAGHSAQYWLQFNPMAQYVSGVRSLVYELTLPSLGNVAVSVACAVVSLGLGWTVFHRYAPGLIEDL
jgi:ABC-type polysaccharide/polyol phosphate export permease